MTNDEKIIADKDELVNKVFEEIIERHNLDLSKLSYGSQPVKYYVKDAIKLAIQKTREEMIKEEIKFIEKVMKWVDIPVDCFYQAKERRDLLLKRLKENEEKENDNL